MTEPRIVSTDQFLSILAGGIRKIKRAAAQADRRAADPAKVREYRLAYNANNKEKHRERSRMYRAKDPEGFRVMRIVRLRRKRERLAGRARPDICEVCHGGSPTALHWDHCHNSGQFRGWLCAGCNLALGNVKDSPATLRALADYLEQSQLRMAA